MSLRRSSSSSLLVLAAVVFFFFILTVGARSAAAGDDEDALSVYDVLQQYNFPIGLLPKGVTGYEINRNTGKFKVYLKETCSYSVQGYALKYKSVITGVISQDRIRDLKGISVNAVFIWWNIQEVRRDGDELTLSVGIASASFGIAEFYESPQCGCGFDCLSGGKRKEKKAALLLHKLKRLISPFLD